MLTKCLIMLALAIGPLAGQNSKSNRPPMDEEGFRRAVQDGLPSPSNRASSFAHRHEDIAIPILVDAIKTKLGGARAPDEGLTSHRFTREAVILITYNGSQRGVDAVADLCSLDQKDCQWLVTELLGGARTWLHPYGTAYDVVDQHPELLDFVMPFVERGLAYSEEMEFAREMLKREGEGHPIRENDPITSRLPAATRERIKRAIANAREESRARRGEK